MTLQKEAAFQRIFRLQMLFGLVGFLLVAALSEIVYALSFLCGVMMMAANGWWMAKRLAGIDGLSVESAQRSLYAGAAMRFVSLIAGLLVAQMIGLHLLGVASGMFVAQAVIFISALVGFKREQD